jgi:sulfatase maturation enzyme AslB (radical SAM superfamily)
LKIQEEPLFYKWLEIGTLKNKECMRCAAIGICGGGCAYDIYVKTGQLGIKEDYFCTFQNEILKLLISYNFLLESQKNKIAKAKS